MPTHSTGVFTRNPMPALIAGRILRGAKRAWAMAGEAAASLAVGTTREASDAIIDRCVELLASGGIVAIKGLGGFHLACDASNEQAVAELRRRKRRSNKPLAVMVRSLADAGRLCHIDDAERDLLAGSIRPIVLLRRRTVGEGNGGSPDALALAPSVTRDLPELGVMPPIRRFNICCLPRQKPAVCTRSS